MLKNRIRYLRFCLISICLCFGVHGLKAQESTWLIGAGPSVELDNGLIGVNARFYYGPNETICFGPELSYFPNDQIESDLELSVLDLNFNGHFILELVQNLGLYALTGLNYSIEEERRLEFEGEQITEKE